MNKIWCCLVLAVCLAVTQPAQADEWKVLFVGNSYIFVNDLPAMLNAMLVADGDGVQVDSAARPGWKLDQHSSSESTRKKISGTPWDYVILQEQSVMPLFAGDLYNRTIPAILSIRQLALEHNAQTLLFMTWGRKNGLAKINLPTFSAMQDALLKAYRLAAYETGTTVVPVGEAWREARRQKPFAPLWQDDGSHPSISGTYLTACVFYATITGRNPSENTYRPSLTEETVQFLGAAAFKTVMEWSL